MPPEAPRSTAGDQAFWLLRFGFVAIPLLSGIDKFANWMVEWPQFLAPWLDDGVPGDAQDFMYVAGAIEIAAALLVAVAPWIGGYVVAGWLTGIIVNLLTYDAPLFYDLALRDVGLAIAALALGRLATVRRRRTRVDTGPATHTSDRSHTSERGVS